LLCRRLLAISREEIRPPRSRFDVSICFDPEDMRVMADKIIVSLLLDKARTHNVLARAK